MISARLGGAIAALLAAFALGWLVNGWRLDAGIQRDKLERQQAFDQRIKAATDERDALAAQLRVSADDHLKQLDEARNENKALRDRVDTGAVRLRVAAKCPAVAAPGMPQAPAPAGVDDGAGAELDPAARPTYWSLRDGIVACKVKVDALQDQLRKRQ